MQFDLAKGTIPFDFCELNPSVSVIIPTYNRAASISNSISSALEQLADIEVIVVDDGSTDNTEEVVRGITDRRVRFIRQENSGSSAARSRGVSESCGQLILFLDSDDYLLPGMIHTLIELLHRNSSAQFAFCEAWFEDIRTGLRSPAVQLPDGDGSTIAQFITIHSQCYNCRFLIRRKAYEATGGYLPEIGVGAPELALFVPLFCRYRFERTREPMVVIRHGGRDHLSRRPEQVFNGVNRLLSMLMSKEDVRQIIGPIIHKAKAHHTIRFADALYSQNRFRPAFVTYLRAIVKYPGLVFIPDPNPLIRAGKSVVRILLGRPVPT